MSSHKSSAWYQSTNLSSRKKYRIVHNFDKTNNTYRLITNAELGIDKGEYKVRPVGHSFTYLNRIV